MFCMLAIWFIIMGIIAVIIIGIIIMGIILVIIWLIFVAIGFDAISVPTGTTGIRGAWAVDGVTSTAAGTGELEATGAHKGLFDLPSSW